MLVSQPALASAKCGQGSLPQRLTIPAEGQYWYFTAGPCEFNPFINSMAFAAADSSTRFRVYGSNVDVINNGKWDGAIVFWPAVSSVALTGSSVTCYEAFFRPGYGTAMIGQAASSLLISVICDSPGGCQINHNVDLTSSCTTQRTSATAQLWYLDTCQGRCMAKEGARCGLPGEGCICPTGWKGKYCDMVDTPSPSPSPSDSGSGSSPATYDPSVWLGTYTVSSGCDQSQCCCAQTSTITAEPGTANPSYYTVTGKDLVGQCGSAPPPYVSTNVPVPTSDSVTYTINGQTHTAQRVSSTSLSDVNQHNNACSAMLKHQTSGATGAAAPLSFLMAACAVAHVLLYSVSRR